VRPEYQTIRAVIGPVLVLLASIPLAKPYLSPGHQIGHDREVPYLRVYGLKNALEEPQIPSRWFPDFDGGYGSPYPSFYAMAFYYAAAILNMLGIIIGAAVELMAYWFWHGSA